MLSSQTDLNVLLVFLPFSLNALVNANTVPSCNSTSQSSSEPMDVRELVRLIFNMTIPQPEHAETIKNHSHSSQRVKRQQQQGESKYSIAAKMPETKMIRLFAQMLANPFSSAYIGGGHPFHPEVPKSIVILFKQKIMGFLFPRIGERVD